MATQQPLFEDAFVRFPSTRYQGSKAKIVEWIIENIREFEFSNCLDAFGGTGVVGYHLKKEGKCVTYNDLLKFNYYFGLSLIENNETILEKNEIDFILSYHPQRKYPTFVQDNFSDIYFNDEENVWIDKIIANLKEFEDPYKFATGFFALCQACIIKRPYNLFHRKNLYIRNSEVERSFGNKTTWDKPFDFWFVNFVNEANKAVFDNGKNNKSLNLNILEVPTDFDLVYIDTPYISKRGVAVDYYGFYHFLEGLTIYDSWGKNIDYKSKHRRLKMRPNEWTNRKEIYSAFDNLFYRFKDSILVVSYRSDGIPSENELETIMKKYKRNVRIERFGNYKYVLSKNEKSQEILLIGF
ncbi:MAG: DNA adenine methylase [Deltaproteobacteria bacterium]|uniref:DNA adenine methylase n=1 Tax=Candidatus Zymogenus saltonus TaxID=2844893 RepID=A0A9D8PN95_9DELT|nr:DNA adenine methylase [Candidatus Zymogenus saltonus]